MFVVIVAMTFFASDKKYFSRFCDFGLRATLKSNGTAVKEIKEIKNRMFGTMILGGVI